MDTWSSCPALVGNESIEDGWQRPLFSETNAAAVQCGIMKPEFKPPFSTKKAGRSLYAEKISKGFH